MLETRLIVPHNYVEYLFHLFSFQEKDMLPCMYTNTESVSSIYQHITPYASAYGVNCTPRE